MLERASARETAARVAAGALAKQLLSLFGIEVAGWVRELGDLVLGDRDGTIGELRAVRDSSSVYSLHPDRDKEVEALIDRVGKEGDTLGGIVETRVDGLPIGLGTHAQWDRKLDGRLAGALMSIQGVKGVEVGAGFVAAGSKGSEVHDEIVKGDREVAGGFVRATNRAGGLEGGMTTGEPLELRVAMKPISTLRRPLKTVNLETGKPDSAHSERADITAVPAMGVIAEAMVALVLADAMTEKFGGDSLEEMRDNVNAYVARIGRRP